MRFKALIRNWLDCPVDGEALLREARHVNLDGTTALIFERALNHREQVAIEHAWKARGPMPPVPPPADTDPGTYK